MATNEAYLKRVKRLSVVVFWIVFSTLVLFHFEKGISSFPAESLDGIDQRAEAFWTTLFKLAFLLFSIFLVLHFLETWLMEKIGLAKTVPGIVIENILMIVFMVVGFALMF